MNIASNVTRFSSPGWRYRKFANWFWKTAHGLVACAIAGFPIWLSIWSLWK